jgi:hypothetical protein
MRMSLTWLGEPGQRVATRNTFKVVVLLVVSYIIYSTSLEIASRGYSGNSVPTVIVVLKMVGSFLFGFWSLYRYVGKRALESLLWWTCFSHSDDCNLVVTYCLVHSGWNSTFPVTP